MAAALSFGRRGLGRTAPNPSVGALVVAHGIIHGRGCTGDGGRPHAETIALAEAGAASEGATIYVTLEPCSHHGVTPPCCEALVEAGIARLVFAAGDPNPLVAGRGAIYCRAHGMAVSGGVLASQAERDHRGHLMSVTRKRPSVTLKLAETADGFVAGGPHDSRLAITGAAANGLVHVMRAMHDAVMIGIGTLEADDPLMTVRLPGVTVRPARVVIDAALKSTSTSRLLRTSRDAPVVILTREGYAQTADVVPSEGVTILPVPVRGGRLDLAAALRALADHGMTRVFSEGGPRVAASLIADGLVDDVVIFTAPKPLGSEGVATLDPTSRAALADPARFRLAEDREVGVDRLRRYESVV